MTPSIIWDAFAGACRLVNSILSFIPALVWAIALLLALSYGGVMHHERDSAVSALNVVKASYEQLTVKVIRQKLEATELYKRLLKERDALQIQIDNMRKAQEKKDVENAKTIADQKRRLAGAADDHGQLRDPAGCGRGSAGPQGQAVAPAASGAGSAAEASGLLSTQLSGLLLRLTGEADDINAAYESARADALMCRQALGASP